MLKYSCLPLLAVLSFSAFAEVSFEEKKNRVEYLEELAQEAVAMNIDAYRRELIYEKENLPLEKRAENEANLIAEKIKLQIINSFDAALEDKTHQEAAEEVREAIDKDLELISDDLRDEIREIAYAALENAEKGIINIDSDLTRVQKVMMKGVQDRYQYLNEEGSDMQRAAISAIGKSSSVKADAERSSYSSKAEIISSLVSDRDNAKFASTANMSFKSDSVTRADSKVSVQLKVNFLGVDLEAGPTILFAREWSTAFNLNAEGMNPVVLSDGNFDFLKRDRNGKTIRTNGGYQKRFLNFSCEAKLNFESVYAGSGGFSIVGIGAGASLAKKYSNTVTMNSRRIVVPEYIDGKTVTVRFLNQICHNDFLKAKVTNTMTVGSSLNMMMKNVLSGLRFSHPKSKCVTDSHCSKWFKSQSSLTKRSNVGRCVEEPREKYRACEVRGMRGQNCAVFDRYGKKVSEGVSEFKCDRGLRCVKVQEEGWLKNWSIYQYAKGVCR